MSEPSHPSPSKLPFRTNLRARTRFEAAAVSLRFTISLARRFGLMTALLTGNTGPLEHPLAQDIHPPNLLEALRFVLEQAALLGVTLDNSAQCQAEIRHLRKQPLHPISRVVQAVQPPELGHYLADILLLSSLPELHSGYAALFRLLHPESQPYPTATLALQWLEDEATFFQRGNPTAVAQNTAQETCNLRDAIEDLLLHTPIARLGIVRLLGDGPWHARVLRPGPGAWDALNARPIKQPELHWVAGFKQVPGLNAWLQQTEVQQAIAALQLGEPCVIAVVGGSEAMRNTRIRALLGVADCPAIYCPITHPKTAGEYQQQAIDTYTAAFMQQAYPWLALDSADETNHPQLHTLGFDWAYPLLISANPESALPCLNLPILTLHIQPLTTTDRRDMWDALLPELGSKTALLAARYLIDPEEARQLTADLTLRQRLDPSPIELDDLSACLRSRHPKPSYPGVQCLVPKADWSKLLLPAASLDQLQQVVRRIHHQISVFDEWGFEQGDHEQPGLRIVFYGPPGTGKTLAAEAMAKALGVDLWLVNMRSLTGNWLGETEKNISGLLDLAASAHALLLVDTTETALGNTPEFGRANETRTGVQLDFLLQCLADYQGLAILKTNLHTHPKSAGTQHADYLVEFTEPDAITRLALWKQHLPTTAPLQSTVNLAQLAQWYGITGAQIRNAALSAAFLAADEASAIGQRHFLSAIEREYHKTHQTHPGFPPSKNTGQTEPAATLNHQNRSSAETYSLMPFDQ